MMNIEGTQILRDHEPEFHSDMDRECQRYFHPWDMRARTGNRPPFPRGVCPFFG